MSTKTILLGARFTPEEASLVNEKLKVEKTNKTDLIRDKVLCWVRGEPATHQHTFESSVLEAIRRIFDRVMLAAYQEERLPDENVQDWVARVYGTIDSLIASLAWRVQFFGYEAGGYLPPLPAPAPTTAVVTEGAKS